MMQLLPTKAPLLSSVRARACVCVSVNACMHAPCVLASYKSLDLSEMDL